MPESRFRIPDFLALNQRTKKRYPVSGIRAGARSVAIWQSQRKSHPYDFLLYNAATNSLT